ncbi:hypothetical protein BDB01DRAFT_843252 [Pilobolus umbonatus]|nr:hypothetical protein BDB01DRAFT_843252 [Pilobolus umbonatus]
MEASKDVERVLKSNDWLIAMPRIFQVLKDQMEDAWSFPELKLKKKNATDSNKAYPEPVSLADGYRFRRMTNRPTETLGEYGLGGITRKCGLIRSAFRPSDDATIFPYLIPANAHLSSQLLRLHEHIQQYLETNPGDNMDALSKTAKELGESVRRAIYKHGVIQHSEYGRVFAYEVDCYGSHLIMDDANTPSLLSLPLMGFINKTDELYINTRRLLLSDRNPWYFNGTFASGIGGPHTGRNMIWPMSLLTQIQTSTSEEEVRWLIDVIKRMANHTGNLMCESFHADKPSTFTRPWFSWANGLAGDTILKVIEHFPHLG